MKTLPQAFCERMKSLLGEDYTDFIQSYELPPVRALRINAHKLSAERFCELSAWKLERVPWLAEGFLLAEQAEELGSHPYHLAGLFYIQEPSAMAPAAALGDIEGKRVLDLCAAPGGKATAAGARIGDGGLLVANEIVPNRARTLLQNVQRMGLMNTVVTNMRPEALCALTEGFFDAVLVDAPCSGEGMFRKDDTAIEEWSPEHVRACALRQGAILDSAARALCPGGRMVYSTCTFSTEENEECVAAFLQKHDDFELLEERRFYPHECAGEGQFYAVLQKKDGAPLQAPKESVKRGKEAPLEAARTELGRLFPSLDIQGMRLLPDGRLILPPKLMPPEADKLHMLMAGLELGESKKGRFEPSHALFQSVGAQCVNKMTFPAESAELAAFLRGESFPAPGISGYTAICVDGFPLGFGKASDGVMKNHFPKGLRRKR